MEDLLFKITETKDQGAIRWQRRALAAEAKVAELEDDGGREATLGEIVDACNALADQFYRMEGYEAGEGFKFYEATHPHEVRCWRQAMVAYDHINGIDMDDVLEEYRDDLVSGDGNT